METKISIEEQICLNSTCLALNATGLAKVEIGSDYIFPKIIVKGKESIKKQKVLTNLSGLSNTNLLFSRILELSFHKSNEANNYVKMGGFGGNTYRLKNLNKRITLENMDDDKKSFKIELYSQSIKRQFTLIILPNDDNQKNTKFDICIDTDTADIIDYDKIAKEHLDKASIEEIKQDKTIQQESYEFYCENVLKFAQKQDKTRFFDIINKKTNEEILFDCPDFILIKDLLWKDTNINKLHYLMIFKNPKLMSLRNLDKSNIELLETALKTGKKKISDLNDISKIHMETYFHYHPSVWQLHIHFVSSRIEEIHKKYMVDEVITNLHNDSDFYKKNIIL